MSGKQAHKNKKKNREMPIIKRKKKAGSKNILEKKPKSNKMANKTNKRHKIALNKP